jgi:hypothetical protein
MVLNVPLTFGTQQAFTSSTAIAVATPFLWSLFLKGVGIRHGLDLKQVQACVCFRLEDNLSRAAAPSWNG